MFWHRSWVSLSHTHLHTQTHSLFSPFSIHISLSVFPLEIARQFSPSHEGNRETQPATANEIQWQIAQFSEQANSALEELRNLQGDTYEGQLLPENDRRNKFFTV